MYFNDFSRIQQQNLLLEETVGAILMIYMHPKLTKHVQVQLHQHYSLTQSFLTDIRLVIDFTEVFS